jgi:hypothetical protein
VEAHRLTALAAIVAVASQLASCGSGGANKAGAGAGSGRTLTFRTGRPGGYFPIETSEEAPGGDRAGFNRADTLYRRSGARAGTLDTLCLSGGVPHRAVCSVTVQLADGSIVAQGTLGGLGVGGTLAVTGGTGSYVGARGTYETTSNGPRGAIIVIRLLGG